MREPPKKISTKEKNFQRYFQIAHELLINVKAVSSILVTVFNGQHRQRHWALYT